MLDILFVVNPAAGRKKANKILPLVKKKLNGKKLKADFKFTEYAGHATGIVKDNINSYNRIISVGGDGTLNEVVNGIAPHQEQIIGVLPIGTGNDFVMNLGYSKNIEHVVDLILEENPTTIKCDIGEITITNNQSVVKRKFVNSLGIGFDAYVAYINQKNKYFSGILSYVYSLALALFKIKSISFEISFNDHHLKGSKLLLAIGNGKTSGGGFYLNPNAEVNDNQLDLTLIDELGKLKIIKKLPLALVNKLEQVPEVSMYKFKSLDVKLNNPYFIHADGEILDHRAERVTVTCIESAINFISGNSRI